MTFPKKARFSKSTFPTKRPSARRTFVWGSVSLFEGETVKVAVVVSKKVFAEAHNRNRARRRVSEALRTHKGLLHTSLLVHPRREVLTVPFTTLKADLLKSIS